MSSARPKSRGGASRTPGPPLSRVNPSRAASEVAGDTDEDTGNASTTPSASRGNAKTTTPTPGRPPSSARPPSSLRFEMRAGEDGNSEESTTPAQAIYPRRSLADFVSPQNFFTPNSRLLRQSQGTKQPPAATPHKKAADKVKELRRRAILNTPGRARRQSARIERNDPMDNLRRLARNLAPKSQPIPSSSSPGETSEAALPAEDDDDDDDDLLLREPRSRLSLNSDSDDDYDYPRRERELQEAVERTRILEEQDLTTHSVELPRRMAPEPPEDARLGRRSSMFDGINDPESDDDRGEGMAFRLGSSPQRRVPFADDSDFRIEVPEEAPLGAEESTFAMGDALDRESGRPSDFQLPLMDDDVSVLEAAAGDAAMGDDMGDAMGFEEAWPESAGEIDSDSDEQAEPAQASAHENRASELAPTRVQKRGHKSKRHALAIPDKHVKKIAGRFMKRNGGNIRFSRETLDRLGVMTDWFFERLGKSLEAYANHAGRKTIRDSDLHLVMKRQRLIGNKATPFFLANKHLDASLQRLIRDPPSLYPQEKTRHQPQGLARNDRRITPFNLDGDVSMDASIVD